MITIREIKTTDAAAFLELCKKLDEETTFMMLEPGERDTSLEKQTEIINGIVVKSNSTLLVAESDSQLVGYVSAAGGDYKRNSHKAHIVIGILQSQAGKGLGNSLLQRLEDWAKSTGLHRLELTVMTHNQRAINRYKKLGFKIEGEINHSLYIDGDYVSEFSMYKLIN
ncbi:MAG: GNAT family N-acetyltransferase [Proteobacteria bacterium]|nr:GNAT family N-acetyltransferase [Pseudomonadota bacterium]